VERIRLGAVRKPDFREFEKWQEVTGGARADRDGIAALAGCAGLCGARGEVGVRGQHSDIRMRRRSRFVMQYRRGASMSTHLGNAGAADDEEVSPIPCGTSWLAMPWWRASSRMGLHLDERVFFFFFSRGVCGPREFERSVLVTDASLAGWCAAGPLQIGARKMWI